MPEELADHFESDDFGKVPFKPQGDKMTTFEEWLESQHEDDYDYPEFIFSKEGEAYEGWKQVDKQWMDSRRWYEVFRYVLTNGQEYWAVEIQEPSTENQEFDWDWCVGKPYQVEPKEVTTIRYEKV